MRGNPETAVLDAVHARGGVARSVELVRAGHTHRSIAGLVARGRLERIRRVWLALPSAEPLARAAAREGVVVTCVTQADRLGLWVLEHEHVHVAAKPHASSPAAPRGTVVHWAQPVVPRPPGMLFDSLENVLTLVARCQPAEAALAVVESALNKRMIGREALLRLPVGKAVRELFDQATPWSDSGLETFVVPRLAWLRLPLWRQIWIDGHRVDLLIGDRLVLQIDGGSHVGAQREQDIAHDAALMLLGYHVIRVGYVQVVTRWHEVQEIIMRAVAQRLHLAA